MFSSDACNKGYSSSPKSIKILQNCRIICCNQKLKKGHSLFLNRYPDYNAECAEVMVWYFSTTTVTELRKKGLCKRKDTYLRIGNGRC